MRVPHFRSAASPTKVHPLSCSTRVRVRWYDRYTMRT
jgi:hypothetical protein